MEVFDVKFDFIGLSGLKSIIQADLSFFFYQNEYLDILIFLPC